MSLIHISETEAVRDFASVLTHVRAGAEVVIESDHRPIAVLRPSPAQPDRLLSEVIASLEKRGSDITAPISLLMRISRTT